MSQLHEAGDVGDIVANVPALDTSRSPRALLRTATLTALVLISFASVKSVAQEPVPAAPEFVKAVSFSEVLAGLDDESVKSSFDRNGILIKAIADRGVGFALGGNAVKDLTRLGANEALLDAIKNGQPKRQAEIDRLDKEFRENSPKNDVISLQKAIAAGWELLDKIGDPDLLVGEESELRAIVTYLKKRLPNMEKRLRLLTSPPPVRPQGP